MNYRPVENNAPPLKVWKMGVAYFHQNFKIWIFWGSSFFTQKIVNFWGSSFFIKILAENPNFFRARFARIHIVFLSFLKSKQFPIVNPHTIHPKYQNFLACGALPAKISSSGPRDWRSSVSDAISLKDFGGRLFSPKFHIFEFFGGRLFVQKNLTNLIGGHFWRGGSLFLTGRYHG